MHRVRTLWPSSALSIILATTLAGCSPIYYDWDSGSIRTTPTEQSATPSSAASHPQSASIRPHKHKPPASGEETSVEPESAPTPAAPPAASTLSMAATGDNSVSAAKVIDATGERLARYDRNRLSGSTLATYDEANGFLSQGKQALAEKDYVAASGFAQKASVLADKLQATVTPR
jgi:hypothetical protein